MQAETFWSVILTDKEARLQRARAFSYKHLDGFDAHSIEQFVVAFSESEVARAWEEAAQVADKEQQHYCEMAKSDDIESDDEAEFYTGKAEACGNVAAALREAARKNV